VAGEEVRVFRDISAWHLALILLAFVVLFGYKKLPDATRSLGRSMRILKSEVKGLHDDEPKQVTGTTPAQTNATAAPVTPPQQVTPPAEAPRPAEVPGRSDSDRA
jgi:sec-independent protein translocase protein TatA